MSALNAYKQWLEAKRKGQDKEFCASKFLSRGALQNIKDLKRQFAEQLSDIGFLNHTVTMTTMQKVKQGDGILMLTGEEANANSDNVKVIRGKH